MDKIQSWYQSKSNRPLIIKGPKGVGKTRLVTDFLSTSPGNKVYANMELNPGLLDLLVPDNIHASIEAISTYFDIDSHTESIIIIDECQGCEYLIEQTLALQEEQNCLRFIFISSYPLSILEDSSDTIEHYDLCTVYPMDFEEFLEAGNNQWYISVIKEHFRTCKAIPDIVHNDILNLFYDYLLIGGMPAAINEYMAFESILNLSEIHYNIQNHQLNSLRLHNSESSYAKLEGFYHTLDLQLAKKNKKFKYNLIRKGATRNQYLDETETLLKYSLILPCQPVEEGITGQKFYLYDVGVLVSKAKMNTCSKEVSTNTELYKGITENYVAQSLSANGYPLYFWESGSQAKIDFMLPKDNTYIPIEVFSTEHTKSKAINILANTYEIPYSIKVSPKNFAKKQGIQYVPLYAVFCI